jgi:alpha-1,2-mannosyltransferase
MRNDSLVTTSVGPYRRLSRSGIIWIAGLCGLCGIAGWGIWLLILGHELGQDWMVFYTAVRAYFDGDLSLVLDGERLTQTINQQYKDWLSTPLIFHPWLYPPHFLLLLLPFGLLSFGASYLLFMLLTFSLLVVAICQFTGRPGFVTAAMLLFPQAPFAFLAGQNNFLTSAIFVGGFGLLGKYPFVGGALLGTGSYKPQLFLLVPIALVVSRQWKALAGAALMALALTLASVAVFGSDIWQQWFQVMVSPSDTYQRWLVAGRLNGQSVFSCMMLAGASGAVANTVQAGAAIVACGFVYWAFSRPLPMDLRLAILLPAVLLASPHVSSQDAVMLAIAALFLFCRVVSDGARPGDLVAIFAIWMIELFDPPIIFHLGIATPIVILGFIAAVVGRASFQTKSPSLVPVGFRGQSSDSPA